MYTASNSYKPIIIRQLADSLTIFIACYISNIYFLSNSRIAEIIIPTISLFMLLIFVLIPVFYFLGIYTFLRSTSNIVKAKKLLTASLASAFLLVVVFMIFNYYFQQDFKFFDILFSDISMAWVLSVIGIMTSRLLVYTYLTSKTDIDKFIGKFAVIR